MATSVVTRKGRGGLHLFLVDRKKFQDRWWSSDLQDAFIFKSSIAARLYAKRLKYGEAEAVSMMEADILNKENEHTHALNEER